jgi:hypothetical protein
MKNPKLGKIATVTGWVLSVLFAVMGISCGGLSLLVFLIGAVLISPTFRNHVHLSGKVWIPLVVILFFAGVAISPQAESGADEITDKQASVAFSGKQNKNDTGKEKSKKEKQEQAAKKQKKQKRLEQEQAKREEQERFAREQAEHEEQERLAKEQAEQERIAQEQAEQQRIAQEQATAQAEEQQRIAQEQAAQQAEQQRIAQEQAEAQANAGLNAFNTYNNPEQQQTSSNYVLNNNTMKFHYPSCRDVPKIAPENYATFDGTRDDALNRGYSPCGHCNP